MNINLGEHVTAGWNCNTKQENTGPEKELNAFFFDGTGVWTQDFGSSVF
jgi:hypothetical protein